MLYFSLVFAALAAHPTAAPVITHAPTFVAPKATATPKATAAPTATPKATAAPAAGRYSVSFSSGTVTAWTAESIAIHGRLHQVTLVGPASSASGLKVTTQYPHVKIVGPGKTQNLTSATIESSNVRGGVATVVVNYQDMSSTTP